jgi:glutamate dehydrogenase/leucine dehydrogenase
VAVSGGGAVGWFLTEKKKGEKMVAAADREGEVA